MKRHWILLLVCGIGLAGSDRPPMAVDMKDSASARWLAKTVLESRALDVCESLGHWSTFTTGSIPLVDVRVDLKATDAERAVSRMSLTAEGSRDGGRASLCRPLRQPCPRRSGPGADARGGEARPARVARQREGAAKPLDRGRRPGRRPIDEGGGPRRGRPVSGGRGARLD